MLLLSFYKTKAQAAKVTFSLRNEIGTKQFIRVRVDTPLAIFFEMLGHQSFSMIQNRTLEEAALQGNKEF